MANYVLKDAYLSLNNVPQSAFVQSIAFNLDAATVDNTCMGDDALSFLPGMKNATFNVTFAADYANGDLSEDLWDIYYGDAAVAFIMKPNGATTGVTNPKYTGNCIMTSYPVADGSVGDLATHNCTFQVTGDVGRAESDA